MKKCIDINWLQDDNIIHGNAFIQIHWKFDTIPEFCTLHYSFLVFIFFVLYSVCLNEKTVYF